MLVQYSFLLKNFSMFYVYIYTQAEQHKLTFKRLYNVKKIYILSSTPAFPPVVQIIQINPK